MKSKKQKPAGTAIPNGLNFVNEANGYDGKNTDKLPFSQSLTVPAGVILKIAGTTHFYDLRKIPHYVYSHNSNTLVYKHGRGVRLATGELACKLFAALSTYHEGGADE